MRKRIKAFSLALLMCAALFTVPVFAWDVSEMDDFLTIAYEAYNDRQHILYCTKCNRNMSTAANHVFTLSGAYYTCSVCGYKTTVKPELNAIIQPMYVERYFV